MEMTPREELLREIVELIEDKRARGEDVQASWVAHEVVKRHEFVEGDEGFYGRCAYDATRHNVGEVLRKNYGTEASPNQPRLPGFERLQRSYLVKRADEQVIVPIERLTRQEMMDKVEELTAMSAGCATHARELTRYMQEHFSEEATS